MSSFDLLSNMAEHLFVFTYIHLPYYDNPDRWTSTVGISTLGSPPSTTSTVIGSNCERISKVSVEITKSFMGPFKYNYVQSGVDQN